ncbi:APC family permease [Dactylosporangium sp. CS-047395]|uniref:APC family permease n=1 Tax=Dactylosporangium sp. CS-047395 TaxID=3239936 RepID=UPI003D8CE64B
MIGAGVFAAFAPAARAVHAQGGLLFAALGLAAVVAYCNASSSARLAALYPESGGTYVYGRRRLGDFWGFLAGWGFVAGKTASCAAMALTVGAYAFPGHARLVAVAAVGAVTLLNLFGVQKSALATRVIVAVVLAVLAVVVVVALLGPAAVPPPSTLLPQRPFGVLEAAALLFFAFAGYARIATLGEEVADPARTIPRAVFIALAVTLLVYLAVAVALLHALGPARLASSTAPIADAVAAAGAGALGPVVRVGAAVAALGSLLALVLGVSRTTLAMARDRHLPGFLAAVHPRRQVPHRAEVAVGLVVMVLVALLDLRGAIGFSSFGVLVYYAIANASALTLRAAVVPIVGLAGCVVLAVALPLSSVLPGLALFAVGALVWVIRRRSRGQAAA